jgi:large subunit ribosomal protein L20
MVRVKKSTAARKHRKHLLKHAKGFRWGRKSKLRLAKDALRHAWTYAFRDRKAKKRTNRQLWNAHINGSVRPLGINYSKFIKALKDNKIEIDRKILSNLAEKQSEIFKKIVEFVTTK